MKPGETRTLKMFIPDLNKICDVTLTAKAIEEVQLGGGVKRSLLRVEQTTMLDGKPRPEYDVDPLGRLRRPGAQEPERRPRAAWSPTGPPGRRRPRPTARSSSTRSSPRSSRSPTRSPGPRRPATSSTASPSRTTTPPQLIPTDRRQTLRPGPDPKTSILEVKTAGPDDGPAGPEQVDDQFLRPNALVTSEDPVVGARRQGRRRRRRPLGEGRQDRALGRPEPQGQELQDRLRPRQRGGAEPHGRLHRARRPDRRDVPRRRSPGAGGRRPGLRRSPRGASASTSGTRSTSTAAGSRSTPRSTRRRLTRSTSSSPTRASTASRLTRRSCRSSASWAR